MEGESLVWFYMADVTRIAERYCAAGLKYSVCAKRVVTTVGNWFVFLDASCVTNHDSDRKQIVQIVDDVLTSK